MPKKLKKVLKPNWMEDVEGVNCLLKKKLTPCLSKQLTPSTSSIQLGLTLF